jgi:hypothetical protein
MKFLCLTCGKVAHEEKVCLCLADTGAAVAGKISDDGRYFTREETEHAVEFLRAKMRHDVPLTMAEQLFILSHREHFEP